MCGTLLSLFYFFTRCLSRCSVVHSKTKVEKADLEELSEMKKNEKKR